MKYKALAKKFRQAVGVTDPVPAAAVLPPDPPEGNEKGKGNGEEGRREHCSEQIRGGQGSPCNGNGRDVRGSRKNGKTGGVRKTGGVNSGRTPEGAAKDLLATCEGTIASLAAQLALMVSADFVPNENIGRTIVVSGGGGSRSSAARWLRRAGTEHVRSSAAR